MNDSLNELLNCTKHNLPKTCLINQDPIRQTYKQVCQSCANEWYGIISVHSVQEANQGLIDKFQEQANSNSAQMHLIQQQLTSFQKTIVNKVEQLINEIKNQLYIQDIFVKDSKINLLNRENILKQHELYIQNYKDFQVKAIQEINYIKEFFQLDGLIKTFQLIDLKSLNPENKIKKFSIIDTQTLCLDQIQILQKNQNVQKYEYQLLPQSSIKLSSQCWSIAFNKNASIVFFGCDNCIRIHEFKNEYLKEIQVIKENISHINCLYFMQKNNQFISDNFDHKIKIWKQSNNDQWYNSESLNGHEKAIESLITNSYEDLIISGGQDKSIIVWTLKNNQWSLYQQIKCSSTVHCLSFNNSNTKLISTQQDFQINLFQYQGSRWENTQKIRVNIFGLRICFIGENEFIFQPHAQERIQFYNFNTIKKQFEKTEGELKIQSITNSDKDCKGFQIKFIKSKDLLLIKNCSKVNILRKEGSNFLIDQSIELSTYQTFGNLSDDGQYLLIFENDQKQSLNVRKFIQKQ